MGMDVYGRAPTSEEGAYWRSSIWGWPTVLDAIAATEVLPDEMVQSMGFNDGQGPDAEQAIALADGLEKLVLDGREGVDNPGSQHTRDMGAAVLNAIMGGSLGEGQVMTPEETEAWTETILAFAKFSRASGGFQVW